MPLCHLGGHIWYDMALKFFRKEIISLKVRLMCQSPTKKFRGNDGILKDPGCRAETILDVYNSTIYNQGKIAYHSEIQLYPRRNR